MTVGRLSTNMLTFDWKLTQSTYSGNFNSIGYDQGITNAVIGGNVLETVLSTPTYY